MAGRPGHTNHLPPIDYHQESKTTHRAERRDTGAGRGKAPTFPPAAVRYSQCIATEQGTYLAVGRQLKEPSTFNSVAYKNILVKY